MNCNYACGTIEHQINRRRFLGLAAGAVAGVGVLSRPGFTRDLESQQKRVLVFNMHGGMSQMESWDPKPGTETGGPFNAIPTSVPGLHISELLPCTARQMHRLGLARGVNTAEDDHLKGMYLMTTGRRQGTEFPHLGAVAAKALAPETSPLPGHVQIYPWGGGGKTSDSAYLGPKYSGLILGNGQPPANMSLPKQVTKSIAQDREDLRRKANERFLQRRRTAYTDAYTYNFEQARQLMERQEIFDASKEPAKDVERYGKSDFGRHCLLARRLLEKGITYVQVNHSNYDTHNENFDFHLEQVGEFDRPFATLIADLHDRGMLESTLVVVLSEFGRTPNINLFYGRDHWSKAWTVLVGGAGIIPGVVHGKTSKNGTEVTEGQVDHAALFHTYLQALGVETSGSFDLGDGRQMPIADPAASAIKELLA